MKVTISPPAGKTLDEWLDDLLRKLRAEGLDVPEPSAPGPGKVLTGEFGGAPSPPWTKKS